MARLLNEAAVAIPGEIKAKTSVPVECNHIAAMSREHKRGFGAWSSSLQPYLWIVLGASEKQKKTPTKGNHNFFNIFLRVRSK